VKVVVATHSDEMHNVGIMKKMKHVWSVGDLSDLDFAFIFLWLYLLVGVVALSNVGKHMFLLSSLHKNQTMAKVKLW
jgi:hypothetical protein